MTPAVFAQTLLRRAFLCLFLGAAVCLGRALAQERDSLMKNFQSPPRETRPTVWWRFMDDTVSREGIVADLESMKRSGSSGGIVSFCSSRTKLSISQPGPPFVPILSKEWWNLVNFQLEEAAKRNLDLWFQACPGYATSGGPWITPEKSMQKLVWSEVTCDGGKEFHAVLPVPTVDKKWNFYRDVAVVAFPKVAPNGVVRPEQVVNLTKHMDASGRLTWKPGAGSWKIIRFGHTTTGVPIHPTTVAGSGLECDKMSRESTRIQFDNYFKIILAQRPKQSSGGSKVELFYDSWEAGTQNWTPGFQEEFRKRRGYDPLPWLPVATGQIIGSEELSRRFDFDWKSTIEEMINSEHFAELARLSRENGASQFRLQPYNGPVNFMSAGAVADIPEGEYWHANKNYGWWTLRLIASVSHVNGKPFASAESLTASPEDLRMDVDPFATKAETDLAFTMGINLMAIPHIPHNPWPHLKPGMTAGPYGMILAGGQVWNDLAGSWLTYLARCCYLLQQGTFTADVVKVFRPSQRGYEPPEGYAEDLCNEERLISAMTWDGDALSLPGGMRYKLLELPETTQVLAPALSPTGIESKLSNKPLPQNISLPLLRKVRELVLAGATVLGPRPVAASGLSGYPACDQEIARIAEELWGPVSPDKAPIDRMVGKGRVISGKPVTEALVSLGIHPDFKTVEPVPPSALPWIHRRIGEDDLYFISNQKYEPLKVTGSFRVDGKIPEFWHADTGTVEPVRSWTRKDGRTEVALEFASAGSLFVRFRAGNAESLPVKQNEPTILGSISLSQNWKVRFAPGMGAPAEIDFPELVSWTERPEKEIRYYSGIATYQREIVVPPEWLKPGNRVILDLGTVKNIARITVNGKAFPELWKPPFTCDITDAVTLGANQISIEVVNVWANRLIGDEQEPADIVWGSERYNAQKRYGGRPLDAYPEWVIKGIPRPSVERRTFTTWNPVKKDQPLLPSGLLGPVKFFSIVAPQKNRP